MLAALILLKFSAWISASNPQRNFFCLEESIFSFFPFLPFQDPLGPLGLFAFHLLERPALSLSRALIASGSLYLSSPAFPIGHDAQIIQ